MRHDRTIDAHAVHEVLRHIQELRRSGNQTAHANQPLDGNGGAHAWTPRGHAGTTRQPAKSAGYSLMRASACSRFGNSHASSAIPKNAATAPPRSKYF